MVEKKLFHSNNRYSDKLLNRGQVRHRVICSEMVIAVKFFMSTTNTRMLKSQDVTESVKLKSSRSKM